MPPTPLEGDEQDEVAVGLLSPECDTVLDELASTDSLEVIDESLSELPENSYSIEDQRLSHLGIKNPGTNRGSEGKPIAVHSDEDMLASTHDKAGDTIQRSLQEWSYSIDSEEFDDTYCDGYKPIEVREAQERLFAHSYFATNVTYDKAVDGVVGRRGRKTMTRSAIASFQKKHMTPLGLQFSPGRLDPTTFAEIMKLEIDVVDEETPPPNESKANSNVPESANLSNNDVEAVVFGGEPIIITSKAAGIEIDQSKVNEDGEISLWDVIPDSSVRNHEVGIQYMKNAEGKQVKVGKGSMVTFKTHFNYKLGKATAFVDDIVFK